MGVYLPNGRLPSAYQEVEYIQSSGTQYFVVGSSFKTSYKFVIDLEMVTTGGDYIPLGALTNDASKRYGINAYGSYFKVIAGGSSWSNTKSEDKNRHTFILNQSTATVDGTNYSMSYVNYTFSGGIGVFGYHNVTNDDVAYKASAKLYKLDIYDENGVHIYDLTPCYRKSDSVIGMYDIINDTFYTNSGTGTFSKGADITMAELKNAYIGQYGYTYSYDFTTGSIADLTSQGWTIPATCSIDSGGITSSGGWTEIYLDNITALYDAIQVANTVDIELVWTKASSGGEHAFNLRGAGNAEPVVMYGNGRYVEFKAGSTLYGANRTTLSAGTYTMTLSIDLANQSATYTDSGWNFSGTASISSSDVTSIRVVNKLFLVCQNNVHLKSISITVK